MNQTAQTLKFAIAAVVSVLLAGGTWILSQPNPVEGFGKVGQAFFPDLDVTKASALMLVEYNEDQATHRDFVVQKQNNVWRLHDYHDYPADGEEQLGKTITSLLGVTRGALQSRLETDHARLGVVDPLTESDELEGRGQRLTIYRDGDVEKGIKMADLIIGKKVPDHDGEYYVRSPEETETYIAKLEIDLSTKFSDWVEDDLLKLDRDNLIKLEAKSAGSAPDGSIVETIEASLSREKSSDDWALAGIDDAVEEVNKDDVREMVNQIDNLKLAGIRPRPQSAYGEGPIVDNDLKINVPPQMLADPARRKMIENQVNGEILGPIGFVADFGKLSLYSNAGELVASAKDGIEYHLNFGDSFKGTEKEIQIGGSKSQKEPVKEKDDKAAGDDKKDADADKADDAKADEKEEDSDAPKTTENRYVFVRVAFNEALLGAAPVEPVEPVRPEVPEGVKVDDDGKPAEPEKKADDTAKADDANADDAKADDAADTEKKDGDQPAATDSTETYRIAWDAYQKELRAYESDKSKYESDVEQRADAVKKAKEKIAEMNDRFAEWYYVISEDDFKKFRLKRETIVKAKELPAADEAEKSGGGSTAPDTTATQEKSSVPEAPETPAPAATDKPAPEKKSTDAENPGATDEAPAAESKEVDTPSKPEPAEAAGATETTSPAATDEKPETPESE